MKKGFVKRLNIPEIRVYLGIIFVFSLIIFYFNWQVGVLSFILFLLLIYYNWRAARQRRLDWNQYLENLSENIDWSTKSAIFSIPMPLVVIEIDGSITWYNTRFSKLFQGENLLDKNLIDYVEDLNPKSLLGGKGAKDGGSKEIEFHQRRYRVTWSPVEIKPIHGKSRILLLLFWQDITDETNLKIRYEEERMILAFAQIDNYDEVLSNTEETKRPVVLAEIEARLGEWAASLGAGWQKFDRDKFIIVMQEKALRRVEEQKFAILDRIREISVGNGIPVTLSFGVGAEGDGPAQLSEYARSALDLALGRGGDQAVVKRRGKLFFYGGRTKAVEKRNKVKSRVIANALRELMEQSSEIFIMSHAMPDLDSFGAALGIYRCARHINKKASIIFSSSNASVRYLIQALQQKEEYQDLFVPVEEALARLEPHSLLVVVDTHRPGFTESPEILRRADRVVVIDHHRRSAEAIENAILFYLEPYASSTSELVTEIVQYFDEKVKLSPLEADAMLAGITLDTKSFTFKTGVRTFEAASYLRRMGADPTSTRQLFQDEMDTFAARAEVVRNARMIFPGIALAQCPPHVENASLIAAQAADQLLNIRGFTASFVLSMGSKGVVISGRSLGNINVQVILEKLGGGGHMTIAGAQLEGIGMEEATDMVIKAVKEYLEEGDHK